MLSEREETLIAAAKEFMLVYFEKGKEYRPSDFDEDILGGADSPNPMSMRRYVPKWNKTYFSLALGDLVESGVIQYEQDDDGYKYFIS